MKSAQVFLAVGACCVKASHPTEHSAPVCCLSAPCTFSLSLSLSFTRTPPPRHLVHGVVYQLSRISFEHRTEQQLLSLPHLSLTLAFSLSLANHDDFEIISVEPS